MRRFLLLIILLISISATAGVEFNPPVAVDDVLTVAEGGTTNLLNSGATSVLTNDSDPEGDPLKALLVSGPVNGSLTLNLDGTFSYTHNGGETTSDAFAYKVNDGTTDGNTVNVTITVTAVNDAPVAPAGSASGPEDGGPITGSVTATDADGGTLSYSLVDDVDPAKGSVTFSSDGTFSFVPATNFNGSATFTYKANDGTANSNTATVTISVTAVNDAPTATGQTVTVAEDGSVDITLGGSDIDGDALTFTPGAVAQGTLTPKGGGVYTFTPNANFNGSTSFTFTASDGTATSAAATISITVTPVNDVPVATGDAFTVSEGGTATTLNGSVASVLTNDIDVDGNTLGAVLVSGPSNGTLTLNPNGTFSYTHNGGETTSDVFSYKVNDGTTDGNTVNVSITVTPVNDAPKVVIPIGDVIVDEDAVNTVVNLSGTFTDADNVTLTVLVQSNDNTSLVTTTYDAVTKQLTLDYVADKSGTATITIRATDAGGLFVEDAFQVTVNAINDAPTAGNDVAATNEDASVNINVLLNDSDIDGDALSVTAGAVSGGAATGTIVVNADNSITFTPAANYNGTATFAYTVSDGNGRIASAQVTVTVAPVNDAPVAVDNTATVNEDAVLTGSTVLANDSDPDAGTTLSAVLVTGPSNGTLTLNANGTYSYTPNANFNGTDQFTYKASDGSVQSNIATVVITVTAVNDVPTATGQTVTVAEDGSVDITLGGSDIDGDALTFTPGAVAQGTLTPKGGGVYTFTPNANFNGSTSFTFTASDGTATSAAATVNITVTAVNDAPSFAQGANQTVNEDAGAQTVTGWATAISDGDPEVNQTLTFNVTNDNNALFSVQPTISSNGTLTYTPAPNATGTATVTVTLKDNGGTANGGVDQTTKTFTITMSDINDAPSFTLLANQTVAEDAGTQSVANAVTSRSAGPNESSQTLVLTVSNNNNALFSVQPAIDANGTLTYTPAPNATGTATVTVTLKDNGGTANGGVDQTTKTFTITVTAVNDAPTVSDVTKTGNEDATVTFAAADFTSKFSDVEGTALNKIQITSLPANGTLKDGNKVVKVGDEINASNLSGLTFVPDPDWSGSTSFDWNGSDGSLYAATGAKVIITIAPVNDPPAVSSVPKSGTEDVTLSFSAADFISKFTDKDGSLAKIQITSLPANGTLKLNGADVVLNQEILLADLDKLTFTPNINWNGSTSFGWNGSDGTAYAPSGALVNITVTPVNDAPTVSDVTKTGNEDATVTFAAADFTSKYSDVEGTGLNKIRITSLPANGTLKLSGVNVALNQEILLADISKLTFVPDADWSGSTSFDWNGSDGGLYATAGAKVIINIAPVNDAPKATNDIAATNEDTPVAVSVLSNDSDADGDVLTVSAGTVTGGAATGTITVNPDKTITFTPALNFSGTATFTYTVADGKGGTATATVTVTVNPVNDPPVAPDYTKSVDEDAVLNDKVIATDVDGGALTYSKASDPNNGTVTVNTDGSYTYTPAPNYEGPDQFTYTVSDGRGGTTTATVNITVKPMPEPPIVSDFSKSAVNEKGTLSFSASDFTGNYTPGDGGALQKIRITSLPTGGTLFLNGDTVTFNKEILLADLNKLTFVPTVNFSGNAVFGWSAFDGSLWAAKSANVTIPVNADLVKDPELIFNEFFVQPPEASQDEFFELLNTNTRPINVDCYSLVVYFNEAGTQGGGTNKGFYVLDLPNITVNPGQYLVGAADNPFDFQGKTGQAASFSWNSFKDANGVILQGGSLKKYTLSNGSYVESNPLPLMDMFFLNKDNNNGGLRFAMFLFNGDTFVNGFSGGTNTGLLPTELTGMPALNYQASCGTNSMALSEVAPSEFVIETTGNANGFIRKYDGICGEWEKSSSGGNQNTNQVEHTPSRTNGSRAYNSNTVDGLTTTAQLNVCGSQLEVQISGAKYDYVFPVTVLVYEDYGALGILDNADKYITSKEVTQASGLFYVIDGTFDANKNYLLVYKVAIGCVDRMIKPNFPSIQTTQRSFCTNGNQIDYAITGGTGSLPQEYLPVNVNIYVDLNGNGKIDAAELPKLNASDLIVNSFGGSYNFPIPEAYQDKTNFLIEYLSQNQNCIKDTVSVARADMTGSITSDQIYTCGDGVAGDVVLFDITNVSADIPISSTTPITIQLYADNIREGKVGVFDNADLNGFLGSTTNTSVSDPSYMFRDFYINGNPVLLVFRTSTGCYIKTVPLRRGCWALPVNLGSFTAVRNQQKVVLKWETLSEQNNKGFYVQRNINGVWENRAFVFSAANGGNSTTPLTYSYKDDNNEKGVSQYRLQQVDLDNKISYSPIRSVRGLDQSGKIIVYPNPSEDGKVNVVFDDQGVKQVIVSDLSGRVIRQYKDVVNNLVIDRLDAGMYMVKIIDLSSSEVSVEKVIIKRR